MALNSDNVRVAVTGGIFVDLSGEGTLPADAVAAIPVDFDELGYVGPDGVVESHNTTTNDLQAWQNGDIVRKVQTTHDVTFQFTLWEFKPEVLEAFYGNYDDGEVQITGDQLPRLPWVIDVFDGDHKHRVCIPSGQITERGDVTRANGDGIGFPVTVTAYPVDGVKAHIYLAEIGSA